MRGQDAIWSADTGDGWYRNPVLPADWSDPDAIRVGDDYILTASSFNRVPGLPLLHSTDLVNWRLIGHALNRLEPESWYKTPRHGCGVWAPSIRFNDGRFWIFYPDPDHGIFVVSAEDPAGLWTSPHLLVSGRGLIDPCPLWDDDGQAYLVHAWALSRAGINNRLTAYRMATDGSRLLDSGTVIVDGDTIMGCRTLEGPKWYRRGPWYWIMAPAGGVATGWQYALRSRQVWGPYEHRVVLHQGTSNINGPHQGAWVDTPCGEDWFLHFQDCGAYGRVTHLQPLRWAEDDWPVIGQDDGCGCGTPIVRYRKPRTVVAGPSLTFTSDDHFPGGLPGPQWTWQANSQPDWLCPPTAGATTSGLGLRCWPSADEDLRLVPNILGQRIPAREFRATTTIQLDTTTVGARAGLVLLGASYAWIGLMRTPESVVVVSGRAGQGQPETTTVASRCFPEDQGAVHVAVTMSDGAVTRFFVEKDPGCWQQVGQEFMATAGRWIGATLGLFALAPPDLEPAGCARFDYMHFDSFHLMEGEIGE